MEHSIEIITSTRPNPGQIKAAILDFDGTLSTLRHGWEDVMEPLMVEMICGPDHKDDGTVRKSVQEYIKESTGIQTIHQMNWLARQVEHFHFHQERHDGWWYKNEYNTRLMKQVSQRIADVESGQKKPDDFLIAGARQFLQGLKDRGITIYIASGTDHRDVVREAEILKLSGDFALVRGAPEHMISCPKEAVIQMILQEKALQGPQLLLCGDGKVEIALGVKNQTCTLGVASLEGPRCGVNPEKRVRLIQVGAQAIVGDYLDPQVIYEYYGM